MLRSLAIVLLLAGISIDAPSRAQEIRRDDGPDAVVTPELRGKVIEGALRRLKEAYVFPDVAKKMDEAIQARVTRKEYDDVTSAKRLAQMLTDHLQAVSHDKHLRVNYLAGGRPEMIRGRPGPEEREKM